MVNEGTKYTPLTRMHNIELDAPEDKPPGHIVNKCRIEAHLGAHRGSALGALVGALLGAL